MHPPVQEASSGGETAGRNSAPVLCRPLRRLSVLSRRSICGEFGEVRVILLYIIFPECLGVSVGQVRGSIRVRALPPS